jgi:hypothetical protein
LKNKDKELTRWHCFLNTNDVKKSSSRPLHWQPTSFLNSNNLKMASSQSLHWQQSHSIGISLNSTQHRNLCVVVLCFRNLDVHQNMMQILWEAKGAARLEKDHKCQCRIAQSNNN